ncbi:MAG: hypothetical protein OEV78_02535 [Spirochaetia bacterium]|nr:hypothetical protein [Spirochaetia bacterium]
MKPSKHYKTMIFFAYLVLFNAINPIRAQTIELKKTNFQSIDAHVDKASKMHFKNTKSLAAYLIQPAKTDLEKIRAIYRWVTANIDYDTKSYFSGAYEPTDSEYVFQSGKSVCEGYSNLFDALAREAGIESVKISGFAKGYGYIQGSVDDKTNHAWNAVKLNGKWYLIDTTWGSGYLENRSFIRRFEEHYFLTSPIQFIYDHFPENPKWQLLDKTISKEEFIKRPYLRPDFFRNGLVLINHNTGNITANDRLTFTLGKENAQANSSILAMLYLNQQELDKRQLFVQSKGDNIEVMIRFPHKGEYILRIFVRPQNEGGAYAWAGDFHITANAGTKEIFPFAYDTSGINVHLLSPIQGILNQGDVYDFSIEAYNAEAVAVAADRKWIHLEKKENRFSGQVKASAGDITVFVKYPGKSNFRGLYKFTGR